MDDMQPLHDVVEGGPLYRLRLQAAAHEVDYALELLPRGIGCTGRQRDACVRQLQLLFTSAISFCTSLETARSAIPW